VTSYGPQIEYARQQAAQQGFSGTAIIDAHPSEGLVRIKIKMEPPERLPEFMRHYASGLAATLNMMNLEAKVHLAEE
jgi:hypothetical protein